MIDDELKTLRAATNQKLFALGSAKAACKTEKQTLRETERKDAALREALAIAQSVAQKIQETAHAKIATIVTRSLQAVFSDPYEFKINFEQKRGRTEASLVFVRDGKEFDPLDSTGGGPVDVASFALRISALLLSQPPVRRLFVMDEPLKFLSSEYRPRMAELILALAKELDLQFLITTHSPEFAVGKVISLWTS
jgi:DNA repair exonuclease SbcCD ATPase subunit